MQRITRSIIINRPLFSNLTTRRFYSDGPFGGSSNGGAGATASSRDWGEKERAIEGQWARINVSSTLLLIVLFKCSLVLQDQQKLNMLRETIEKQKIATGEMRKDIEDLKEILDLKKKNQ